MSSNPNSQEVLIETNENVVIEEKELLVTELNENEEIIEEEKENQCTSAIFLTKRTKSFQCLEQRLFSNSSLLRHPLYHFPPLEDPGIDDAFNFVEPLPIYDTIGINQYMATSKELVVVPLARVLRSLETDTLDLKYYDLTLPQLKILMEVLKNNTYIQYLDLEGTKLEDETKQILLNDMLEINSTITVLNLSKCFIGPNIIKGAFSKVQLLELDLSFNDLGDEGFARIKDGLSNNSILKKLNLSHNKLTEKSADFLQLILTKNNTLDDLNLSWNQFSTVAGNRKIFKAMRINDSIRVLNLAWNGISMVGAVRPVLNYVKKSETIEELDLSSNGLFGRSLRIIRGAMLKNMSLKRLMIGSNLATPDDALFLATALVTKPIDDKLKFLDMSNFVVKKEFLELRNRIQHMNKNVVFGDILGNYEIHGPNVMKLLFERCNFVMIPKKKKKKKKKFLTFGHFVLLLPETKKMTQSDFKDFIKKKKIRKLDNDLIKELLNNFMNKRKRINVIELRAAYMALFPDTCLPPPKKKKRKKRKARKSKKLSEPEVKRLTESEGVQEERKAIDAKEIEVKEIEGKELEVKEVEVKEMEVKESEVKEMEVKEMQENEMEVKEIPEENPEINPEENHEEISQENPGQTPEENLENIPQENPEKNTEENPDEIPEEKQEVTSSTKPDLE